jgi:hypothetical protein
MITDNIVDVESLKEIISKYIDTKKIKIVVIYNLRSRKIIINNIINRVFYYRFLNNYYAPYIRKYNSILENNVINIFNDTEYFNIFLIKKYPNFNLLEDGLWAHSPIKKNFSFFIKFFILNQPIKFGNSSKIKKIIVKDIDRLPHDLQKKGEKYSINNLVKQLTLKNIETLKNIFFSDYEMDALAADEKKIIILTQPISEEGYITEDEKVEIYNNIINKYNIFLSYKVYIKNHPRDLTDYSMFIESVSIIPGHIPFEIFSLVKGIHFDIGITLWSSSIFNVDQIDRKIFLGQEYIHSISKRK